jgi:DNA repair photolyase
MSDQERMFPLPPRKNQKTDSEEKLPPEQEEVLDKVAKKVVEKRMTVPALMFIESVKPLNFIGSQVMVFFEPIVQSLFDFRSYTIFREAIESRDNVELLMQKIEKYDARSVKFERAYKIMKKRHMKGKPFLYKLKRWFLGYRVPTDEVRDFARQLEEEKKRKRDSQSSSKDTGRTGFDDKDKQ